METFRNITFIACLISIVISMFDIITLEGKFKKQVRLIFALVFVISVINPILHGKIDLSINENIKIEETEEYVMANNIFYDSLAENYSDNIENILKEKLLINEIKPEKIYVNVNINQDNCIDINEVRIVLALEHKNKTDKVTEIIKNEIGNYPVKITFTEEAL